MKQMRDNINEISSQFQADGPLPDTSHFRGVMERIQKTLDSMTHDEIISFCKMKIEEEVTWKAEKIEREKQISQLEASLRASTAEVAALKSKNAELKYAVSTIYGEYKKETSRSNQPPPPPPQPPQLPQPPQPSCRLKDKAHIVPFKPPVVPVQLNKRPLNFILPDIPPEDNPEFITGDVKTEYPEVPILPMNSEMLPEMISTIKQQELTCAQNGVPPPSMNPTHYLVISPSSCYNPSPPQLTKIVPVISRNNNQQQKQQFKTATTTPSMNPPKPKEISQIQNDSLDIEDRIPHALITCKSVLNSPPGVMCTSSKVKTQLSTPKPPSTNNIEVFKVLQSIDLTHEQKISEQKAIQTTTSSVMNNCFPRIVSTQSLALQPKVCESAKPPVNLTANSPVSNNTEIPVVQSSSQLLIPGSFSSNLLNSNGQTILNGANPMQIAYIVNGAPGSQGPQQMYFTLQPQTLQGNTTTFNPQNIGSGFFCQTGSAVTSETGPMMIPQISGVTSLGKSVHGAVKHTNSTGTQLLDEVFDLTNDTPNSKSGNAPLLTYSNVSDPGKKSFNAWTEDLDKKLVEVKKRIYLKASRQLGKIALVKISQQEKKAADSKIRTYQGKNVSKFSGTAPATLIKKYI